MGLFSGGSDQKAAGLFIFSGVMQYVELSIVSGGLMLEKCIDMPYDIGSAGGELFADPSAVEDNLKKLRNSVGRKWPKKVFAAIQSKDVLLRTMDLPKMEIGDIKAAFRYEFDRFFPIPVDDAVYDVAFIDRPPQDDATQGAIASCLASTVRKSSVENFMRACQRQGLKLSSIEPSPVAMLRCLVGPTSPMGYNVYALAGLTSSIIVATYRENGLVFRNTAQAFAASDAEDTLSSDLARDLQATVNFSATQSRGFSPDKIYIGGYGASLGEKLRGSVASVMKSPVEIVNPWKLWNVSGTPKDAFGWEISLGLALRGLEVDKA